MLEVNKRAKRKDHYKMKVYSLCISDVLIFPGVGNVLVTLGFFLFLGSPLVT